MARSDRWVGFAEVEHWLGRLHTNSRGSALTRLSCFMDWLVTQPSWEGKTPSDLVRLQRKALFDPVRQFEVLNLLQTYVSSACDSMSVETKKQTYTVVRGFFEHNRAPLPLDKSFKIRGSRNRETIDLRDVQGRLRTRLLAQSWQHTLRRDERELEKSLEKGLDLTLS